MYTTNARTKTGRTWRGALAILVGMSMLIIGWTPAGATGSEPEVGQQFCWGFTDTRLMNDGISTSAGPFPIHLPPGVYDVMIQTHDNHPSPTYQVEQTEEQVYLVLDSNWTSGFTNDIPADQEWMTTTFSGVTLQETKAMTVVHRQFGVINSLNVIKVCFTYRGPIPAPPPAVEPAAPEVEEPVIAPPVAPEPPAPAPAPAPAPEPVEPEQPVAVQVEGVTELALTGASRSQTLAITGVGMVLLGLALTIIDRRRPDLLALETYN